MRKYISVLALDVRCTIYKILGVIILMSGAQLGNFYRVLQRNLARWNQYNYNMDPSEYNMLILTFEQAIEEGYIQFFFGAMVVFVCAILIWGCSEHGKVRSRFLLWRLRIERRQVYVVWSIYRTFIIALVIAWQLLLVVIMNEMYQSIIANEMAPQSLFLAFYRNLFLHSLLPLSDVFGMVWLSIFVVLCGMGTAYIGYRDITEHQSACSAVLGVMAYATLFVTVGILSEVRWLAVLTVIVAFITIICMIISVKGSLGAHYDG